MTTSSPIDTTTCPQCGNVHPAGDEHCPAGGSPDAASLGQARTIPEEDTRDPLLRTCIGQWTILRRIGGGGMGTVYLASNLEINSQVAVKVLKLDDVIRNSRSDSLQENLRLARERFLREAKVAAQLGKNDPGIVQILDYGHLPDGRPYMVMEYLYGRSLDEWLKKGAPPPDDLRRWLEQLCDALTSIHKAGVIHRDLKPENIWITEPKSGKSSVKLIDFGISKAAGTAVLTRVGELAGSPCYMPLERLAGQPGDARSDIYSVGVILHEIVTGQVPFSADNLPTLVTRVMHEVPPPLVPRQGFESSPKLEALVHDCLAKKPEERPQTVHELKQRLLDALDWPGEVARSPAAIVQFPTHAPALIAHVNVPGKPTAPPAEKPAEVPVPVPVIAPTAPAASLVGPPAACEDPGTQVQITALTARRRQGIILLVSAAGGFLLAGGGYALWKHLTAPPIPVNTSATRPVPPAMAATPAPPRPPPLAPVAAPATAGARDATAPRRHSASARARDREPARAEPAASPLQPAPAAARIERTAATPPSPWPAPPPAAAGVPEPVRLPLPETVPSWPSRKLSPSERDLITDEKVLIGD